MNRYDTISTSTYDPRSLQETLMVPMMRRQQHDEANKQLYTQLGELDKINPLDKHYNEAQRIKSELTSKINSQAEKLATEGFNVNTTSDLFKTNRDVQEMYSPTGKVGQINAAKIAYDKDSAEYLKNATALGHSPEVVQRNLKLIQDKYNQSAVYDDKGRVISMSIDAMPPKYIDHISRAREFFKDAGMNSSDIESLASNIQSDEKGNYVLSTGYKNSNASNKQALQSAVNFLNNEINNPNSDVGKSLKYGFKTPKEAIEDIKMMSPIYRSNKTSSSSSSQISSYTPNTAKTEDPNGSMYGEDYNVKEIGGKNSNSYNELKQIGSPLPKYTMDNPYGRVTATAKNFSVNDIKDPAQKAIYTKMFQLASTKGVMVDGKLMKLKPDFIKKGMDDETNAKFLIKAIEQNPITLKSKLLTTDQILSDQGFVAGLGKNIKTIDANIRRQFERTGSSGRKLVDPKTGDIIDFATAKDRYNLQGLDSMHYQGFISAHNWEDTDGLGSNSKFSPHVVTLLDDKGRPIEFKTSRLSSDNIGGNTARQNDLTKNYRNATLNYDNWNDFESKSGVFKGIKIKYSPSSNEVDQQTGEPKNWIVKFKNGQEIPMPESVYMNWVNSVK